MLLGQDIPTYHLRMLRASRPHRTTLAVQSISFGAWRAVDDKLALDILKDCNIGRKPPPADPHIEYPSRQPQAVAPRKGHFEHGACARSTHRTRSHLAAHVAGEGALVDNLECVLANTMLAGET